MVHHKKRGGMVTAEEVALAACRALMRSEAGEGGQGQAKKAAVLARFALAMKS